MKICITQFQKINTLKKLLSFILIIFLFSCSSNKKMTTNNNEVKIPPSGGGGADKQGHRGCRGLMPENTIPAMVHALDLGVTTLEMDISISKDKKVFLSHEPFFNHEITTKPDGSFIDEKDEKNYNLYLMNYDSIKKYDVGMKPHPRFPQQQKMKATKPLLADVFATIKQEMMTRKRPYPFFNIETKTQLATDNIYHPAPSEFVELLMKVIKENAMEDFVIIQSFDFRTLQYLHQHYPTIKTAMLIEDFDKRTLEEQIKVLGFSPTIYSPAFVLVNDNLIKKCHLQDIQVIPWTVNDKAKMAELKTLGVDGIITDYPNLFNE
jgi:glycerophosphoryl diester phosphodiesterase